MGDSRTHSDESANSAAASGRAPSSGAVVLRTNWLQKLIAPVAWALIVLAAARPVWVEDPIEKVQAARDLMLAVDLSGSMDQKDFELGNRRVDRLTATKAVASDFISRREGDRIGLILFGERAYLQVPLTLDLQLIRLGDDRILVNSAVPVIVNAAEYDLAAGVEKLREVAGLPAISNAVPVTFSLVFTR